MLRLAWGARGPEFKSRRSDQPKQRVSPIIWANGVPDQPKGGPNVANVWPRKSPEFESHQRLSAARSTSASPASVDDRRLPITGNPQIDSGAMVFLDARTEVYRRSKMADGQHCEVRAKSSLSHLRQGSRWNAALLPSRPYQRSFGLALSFAARRAEQGQRNVPVP
jgi:hypothetical protein